MLGRFWVKIEQKSTKNAKVAYHFFPGTHFSGKNKQRLPRNTWVACMTMLGPARNYREQCGAGTVWVIFRSKSGQNRPQMARWHVTFFQDMHFSGKKRNCATPEEHGLLAWLALACLAYLASDRPRSPCLHLATTARPPSAAGRRGAPLLLLLVQARRARPMRGGVSQARLGLVHTTHVFGD